MGSNTSGINRYDVYLYAWSGKDEARPWKLISFMMVDGVGSGPPFEYGTFNENTMTVDLIQANGQVTKLNVRRALDTIRKRS